VLETILEIDEFIFLHLNGWHLSFLDTFFYYATKPLFWIPLYLLIIYLVIRMFRWKSVVVILGAALMIAASDQSANFSKYNTKRLRPTHEPQLKEQVHVVNEYRGGQYSFFSAHASTNFAIALYLILLMKRRYRWLVPVLLVYASIMAYSRIYLGVHYPGDILVGAAYGCLLAIIFSALIRWMMQKMDQCMCRS
jgi:undecaprenyl-diphosphatase